MINFYKTLRKGSELLGDDFAGKFYFNKTFFFGYQTKEIMCIINIIKYFAL
jgi:hypothetical protein